MITTEIAHGSRILSADGAEIAWRGLARRGMLHSECQAIDHVRLSPGAEFDLRGRHGTESAWIVLGGRGVLAPSGYWRDSEPYGAVGGQHQALGAGAVILAPHEASVRLVAGGTGLELLWISLLQQPVVDRLPRRVPVYEPPGGTL